MTDKKEMLGWLKNKTLTRILASDVCIQANEKWYDCLAIKIAYLPSIGHLDINYDFNQIEIPTIYNLNELKLKISPLKDSLSDGFNFKMFFNEPFLIDNVKLFGGKITLSKEFQTLQLNILLLEKSATEKVLFIPDYNTSRIKFTVDQNEIHNYLTDLSINSNDEFEFQMLEI